MKVRLLVAATLGIVVGGCGAAKTGAAVHDMATGIDVGTTPVDAAGQIGPDMTATAFADSAAPPSGDAAVAASPDLAVPLPSCIPDPITDGQPCGNGCPVGSGTIPVNDQALGCRCWYSCTPMQNTCPCGRRCDALYSPTDGGLKANGMGACIPANGGGERCGVDAKMKPYGSGGCQEGALCVNEDQAGKFSYCMYSCAKQADCPTGTTCLPLQNGSNACIINDAEANGKAVGAACVQGDLCTLAAECDGALCRKQCDGPKDVATCTGGKKCVALTDMANQKIAAWVCK